MCSGSEAGSYLRLIDFWREYRDRLEEVGHVHHQRLLLPVLVRGLGFSGSRANMAHLRQSRPDSGRGFQVEMLKVSPLHSAAGWRHSLCSRRALLTETQVESGDVSKQKWNLY